MCFEVADGIIRGFILIGIGLGALYFRFLSRLYIRYTVRIIKFLLKPVAFILKNVAHVITIPIRSFKRFRKDA